MKTLPGKNYCFGSYAHQRENPQKIFIYTMNLQEHGRFWPGWNNTPWVVTGKCIVRSEFASYPEAIEYALDPEPIPTF